MDRFDPDETRRCYDLTAAEYSKKFVNELDGKAFDRNLLERYARMIPKGGQVYDFGCGSGHIGRYLQNQGRQKVVGLDFSEKTIEQARQTFPEIEFYVDDMLDSKMSSESADGILAFYAIVHFTYREVKQALLEWYRLLKPGGLCLFSYHVGKDTISVENFLDVPGAGATWRFLKTERILKLAEKAGFQLTEAVERYPYTGVEHPSRRAYVILRKPEQI
ncbi:MAG: class I SAM-dependent methyltransferase [Chloroflexi bacterium]|jgi:SAM-dependent methyltransferase|nr:class I SAM-dependent methyltransferase [Chloroflexota bacterium]BCY17430.1 methyltransferase [Leptolinea sp. HRD-7]